MAARLGSEASQLMNAQQGSPLLKYFNCVWRVMHTSTSFPLPHDFVSTNQNASLLLALPFPPPLKNKK